MGLLADDVELPLEVLGINDSVSLSNEELPDDRFDRLDALPETGRVNGNVTPTEHDLTLADHELDQEVLRDDPIDRILRQKNHADAVVADRWKIDSLSSHLVTEEYVWYLEQHAGSIAGKRIGAHRAAVRQVGQHRQALCDDLMAPATLDVRHKPYATRITPGRRVVKPLRLH